MKGRLAWEEIQKQYPDQWVGLVNVKYLNDDGVSIESAVAKYTDLPKGELTKRMLDGEIISRFTTPDNIFQIYQRALGKQKKEVRELVMVGLEQIKEGKTKDFNTLCDRLEKKYRDEAISN